MLEHQLDYGSITKCCWCLSSLLSPHNTIFTADVLIIFVTYLMNNSSVPIYVLTLHTLYVRPKNTRVVKTSLKGCPRGLKNKKIMINYQISLYINNKIIVFNENKIMKDNLARTLQKQYPCAVFNFKKLLVTTLLAF